MMMMNHYNIKVGKLYRTQIGILCWGNSNSKVIGDSKVINDPEKESVIMTLGFPVQRLLNINGCENYEVMVLLENGDIGWIYDYHFTKMKLIEH